MGTWSNSYQVVFDDEGNWSSVEEAGATNMMVVPFESLSAFDGEEIASDWTLSVTDTLDSLDGTLWSWAVDAYPEGYGAQACPPASCARIDQFELEAPDGFYWLTSLAGIDGEYECAMDNGNGAWTKVVDFDRENEGDGIADFESWWDVGTFVNDMSLYQELTSSIQYQGACRRTTTVATTPSCSATTCG